MTHLEAIEQTIAAVGRPMQSTHVALAELGRTLARQMDAAGEEPSTRLSAAYLSVLKDIGRIKAPVRGSTERANKLAALRAGRVTPIDAAAKSR